MTTPAERAAVDAAATENALPARAGAALIDGADPAAVVDLIEAQVATGISRETEAGWRRFTVLHGPPEDAGDTSRLLELRHLAADSGTLIATRGGDDWTQLVLRGPAAAVTLLALEGYCSSVGRSWWRWTTDGTHPTMNHGHHPGTWTADLSDELDVALRMPVGFDPLDSSTWHCLRCGCTDTTACNGGCSWVAAGLCSACV